MGGSNSANSSNISNSTDINKYGEWKYDSDCYCDETIKKVNKIELIDVHMMSWQNEINSLNLRIHAGIFTLGLSEACIFQGHRITHDAIQAKIECKECGKTSYYTLEFRNNGASMNNGYFNKIFHIDHEYYPTNMNLKNLRNIYELYEGRKYHPIRYNCKNWAKDVFNRIKNDF